MQWLSELTLFYFTIRYQTDDSNNATDTLIHHQFNPCCDFRSETNSDKVEVLSYSLVCEAVGQCLNSSTIPEDLKQKAQDISCVVQSIVEEEDKEEIVSTLNTVSIFGKVTLEEIKKESRKIQYLDWCINGSQLVRNLKHLSSPK